jgi:hypothetical protein
VVGLIAAFLLAASVPPLVTVGFLAASVPTAKVEAQSADITVRGCVERDAASRAPVYKLIEQPGSRIFHLTAPKDIDVASQVGHTVDVTGTMGADAPGRQTREPELVVKKLAVVRDSCTSASE